jgi:oligopeptide/dipeptide ABC transporter ATP-binding protein
MTGASLVEVDGLRVETDGGERAVLVDGVSFAVDAGEAYGLVGESGSGKTLTLRALAGLLPLGVRATAGDVRVGGVSMLHGSERTLARARRGRVGFVFQNPMSALNPLMAVGEQIAEVPRRLLGLSRRAARARALELMQALGIPDPARRYGALPHQLSGGQRQRVMIAIALSGEPQVLLCDEPTTALDVTIQDQILRLVAGLRAERGLTIVFVSHDLPVVARMCERLSVMYAGEVVEAGDTRDVLARPRHPYAAGLLRSVPRLSSAVGGLRGIAGVAPDPAAPPPGCRFAPRCPLAEQACTATRPALEPSGHADHLAACLRSAEVPLLMGEEARL